MDNVIDITMQGPFRVGDWYVDPDSGRIQNRGAEVKLEPKVMTVLICLAQNHGKVVSREALEATIWAGMVVGYDALSSSVIKLRKALGDDSHNPKYIETVSKKGYRLIAKVSQDVPGGDRTEVGKTDTADPTASRRGLISNKRRTSDKLVTAGFVVILVSALWLLLDSQLTDKSKLTNAQGTASLASGNNIPSIAVLPFTNASGDPSQDHFASGMTEYLITDLSRLSNLLVIAHSSVRNYKSESADLQDVGKDLGVRYVMTGSIIKNKDQIRVMAQLVDTTNNIQVWADRFDRKLDDVIAVQDELTQNIVTKLAVKLTHQEQEQLNSPINKNFAAYDLVLEGQKKHFQHTKESNKEAQEIYKQAIKSDSDYARAYSALSVSKTVQFRRGWADSPMVVLDRAKELAQKAIELDESLPQAYWALSYAHLYRQEYDEAARVMKQGITIAPSYADGYGLLALIYNSLGESKKAIELLEKGMKLNPYYTWDFPYNLGRAYYTDGQVKQAIPLLQEALERNENALFARMFLAACFARNGQIEDARWEVEQIMMQSPDMTLSKVSRQVPLVNADLARAYLEDLRKAGLPE